jgi:hypothetical protein
MANGPQTILRRTMGEWQLHSQYPYKNPFGDVVLDGTFTSPTGTVYTIPGFYDGQHTWRVRFNPAEAGRWTFQFVARPGNPDLMDEGSFEVLPNEGHGFLKATPGQAWGFHYESGEPVFIFGDTVYELFGMAHCGTDILPLLRRRAAQGFNLLRARVPCSAFQSVGEAPVTPEGFHNWHTRSTWPWGGAEQAPRFDVFNLEYFHTVDRVVRQADELGLGLEMIMEAWGNEFPFNSRHIFVPEWEEFWMRYLIARYDAFANVYIWTLLNEYEYYPNGDWHYKPVADRWAMRVGRWVKGMAQHGHPVAIHNGPREPDFASRLRLDPEAIDVILFQDWGTRDKHDGWLAAGIEDQIARSFKDWYGSVIFAEWGYERNPALPSLAPHHDYCDPAHTRRGAWRGAFCGLGLIHGFENSWGIFPLQPDDQAGMVDLLHVRHFFTEVVPFHRLHPMPQLVAQGEYELGHRPLAMATEALDLVVVYLPTGGEVQLCVETTNSYQAQWFNPRTREIQVATPLAAGDGLRFAAPADEPMMDWVLLLRHRAN